MDTSSFSEVQPTFPDAELLPVSGSTCDCYRVRLYGRLHFLKRLKPELCTNPRYVAALQKEFATGYPLDHPNLVRYISKGDDYLLMDYVDGEPLSMFLASHPDYFKSRKHTDRLLCQLFDVVNYLHQRQIVHLDLNPDNILITRIGHDVKLIDLGFCYTDSYTDTMGWTDKYAAPEQLEGGAVDARTDIYALGKIIETLPVSYKYKKVIARCTKADKQQRYQSVEEIKHQLNTPNHRNYFLTASVAIAIAAVVILWWPNNQERTA
jgi:serine/threonine protein kinase